MSKSKTPKPGSQQQVVKRPPCVLFSVREAIPGSQIHAGLAALLARAPEIARV